LASITAKICLHLNSN